MQKSPDTLISEIESIDDITNAVIRYASLARPTKENLVLTVRQIVDIAYRTYPRFFEEESCNDRK